NYLTSTEVVATKSVKILVAKTDRKLSFFVWIARKGRNAPVVVATQHKFTAAQKRVRAFEFRDVRLFQMPAPVQFVDGTFPALFPDVCAHLQRLDDKLRFYDAAGAGF